MTIEIDDSNLNLQEIRKNLERQIQRGFGQILSDAVAEMQLRIQSGRDVNNAQFKPYTPAYREQKAKKTGGAGTVNLLASGLMLASIQQKVQQSGDKWTGTIYFANPVAAARAIGNIENGRDFFGLTEAQQQSMYDRLKELVDGIE